MLVLSLKKGHYITSYVHNKDEPSIEYFNDFVVYYLQTNKKCENNAVNFTFIQNIYLRVIGNWLCCYSSVPMSRDARDTLD